MYSRSFLAQRSDMFGCYHQGMVMKVLRPEDRRYRCGSGHLTRHLLSAGHRVIASDASPAMLEQARGNAPNVEDLRLRVLPDDPIPSADAIVSVGHVLSYLPHEEAIAVLSVQSAARFVVAESSRSTSAIPSGARPGAMRRPARPSTTNGCS